MRSRNPVPSMHIIHSTIAAYSFHFSSLLGEYALFDYRFGISEYLLIRYFTRFTLLNYAVVCLLRFSFCISLSSD